MFQPVTMSLFVRQRPYFFCLSKRNRGKKTTPYSTAFGFPALLSKQGVCGTRPNRPHTPLACRGARTGLRRNLIVHFDCSARRQRNRIPPKISPLHHCTTKLRKPHYQLSRVGRFWPRVYLIFKRPRLQLNELKAAKYGEFNVDCHFDFDDIFVAIDRKNRRLYFIDILSLTRKMF